MTAEAPSAYERHMDEMVALGGAHECASDCPQPQPRRAPQRPEQDEAVRRALAVKIEQTSRIRDALHGCESMGALDNWLIEELAELRNSATIPATPPPAAPPALNVAFIAKVRSIIERGSHGYRHVRREIAEALEEYDYARLSPDQEEASDA